VLFARTPCCRARIRTDGLANVGDTRRRRCRVCQRDWQVTVAPARLAGYLRLEWTEIARRGRS